MEVVHARCAGIDVHKRDVKVCLIWRDERGARQQEVRTFGTMTPDLQAHFAQRGRLGGGEVSEQPSFFKNGEFARCARGPIGYNRS